MKELEDRLQQECYMWFHNKYPEYRGLLCYNLNNSRNKIEGSRNKGMGLQDGRSDLVFYYQKRAYMIEMKTDDGSQRPNQKIWQGRIEAQGFLYVIVRSVEEFKNLIISIINNEF